MLFSALSVIFLWLAWIIAYALVGNEYVLPSFWETVKEFGRLLIEVSFWRAFGNTLLRTLWAFAFSLVLGVGLALLASLHEAVRAVFAPIISLLRTVPTMAIILMLLIWTNPRVAPVIVSLLVLFPSVYAATLAAVDEVGENYGELAKAYGVSVKRKIFKMYLPLAAPSVLKQSGAIFSMGLKITISGEVLSQTFRSLGGMMQQAQTYLDIPRLLALTILAVVLGFLLEGLCALAYKLVVRWRS